MTQDDIDKLFAIQHALTFLNDIVSFKVIWPDESSGAELPSGLIKAINNGAHVTGVNLNPVLKSKPGSEQKTTIDFIKNRIQDMLGSPEMWGKPAEVELQIITLLEVQANYYGADDSWLYEQYRKYRVKVKPYGIGVLGDHLGHELLTEFLSDFINQLVYNEVPFK